MNYRAICHAAVAAAVLCFTAMPVLAEEDGVTATTITLGQSAAFSGPASSLGIEMRKGIEAYLNHVNSEGGVNGRKLVLKSLDDGYEADRAAANTKKLINDEKVFALLGYVGTPTSNASLPVFTAAKVPFVGPFTGAESLRQPVNRYIFNVRASYYQETEKIVEQLTSLGMKKIAVFYQNDAYGKAGLTGVELAMKKRKLPIAALGTVERNTVTVSEAVQGIATVEPQAVIMISAYKSCAAFIKEMKKAGSNPQFMNVSFVGSKALADELQQQGRGVGISQVVPYPWSIGTPIVKEYQKLMVVAGSKEFNFSSLEGFMAAKVLVEGIKRTGKDLTRERLIASMEGLKDYDIGGFRVTYSPEDRYGSKFVELTVIGQNGKFLR
ncbi:MAG: ABC transporter substrate-binding protein [Burkholderiales bacterium]|nr:ABC transporter substrate-binding protein [Burkholderiales bacterium]